MAPSVQIGDYDFDGFYDILIPVKTGSTSFIQLWRSVECNEQLCTKEATIQKRRAFELQLSTDKEYAQIYDIKDAFTAAFIDFDEDGTNDIFILTRETNGTKTSFKIHSVYNYLYGTKTTYFLKVMGLNGVCTERCGASNWLPDPKPYGVNQFGATIKFTYSDLNSLRRTVQIPQLYHSAFLSLETPYAIIGLDRPSNYIDYLFYGIPKNNNPIGKKNYAFWPGIIPNAQIVCVPYQPGNPEEWTIELYVSPSSFTLSIFLSVFGSLLVIGIAICCLNSREKKQDEDEQLRIYSFRAL
jgi:hypothetical protein